VLELIEPAVNALGPPSSNAPFTSDPASLEGSPFHVRCSKPHGRVPPKPLEPPLAEQFPQNPVVVELEVEVACAGVTAIGDDELETVELVAWVLYNQHQSTSTQRRYATDRACAVGHFVAAGLRVSTSAKKEPSAVGTSRNRARVNVPSGAPNSRYRCCWQTGCWSWCRKNWC